MTIGYIKNKAVARLRNLMGRRGATRNDIRELLWARVFDFAIRDSVWFKRQSLNPGRWAVGFPALYLIYRTLSEMRPRSILEMGLGESSKLTSQYAAHYGDADLTIIEQDESWRGVFCANVSDVSPNVKCLPLAIRKWRGGKHYSYEGFLDAVKDRKYDLIIVDGPWGSKRDSRDQVLGVIEAGLLSDRFAIIIDDTDRRGEKDTVKKIRRLLKKRGMQACVSAYKGCKDTTVICSGELRFLCSL